MVVISAPSGTGENTIIKMLLKKGLPLEYSISTTTRKPRRGERHARHYYFLTHEQFIEKIKKNEFLEHARLLDNYYGTSIQEIERIQRQEKIPILDIDVQGALQMKGRVKNLLMLFIIPPSLQILEERLLRRNTETPQEVKKRLRLAEKELACKNSFDHVIVNDQLRRAVQELCSLIKNRYL